MAATDLSRDEQAQVQKILNRMKKTNLRGLLAAQRNGTLDEFLQPELEKAGLVRAAPPAPAPAVPGPPRSAPPPARAKRTQRAPPPPPPLDVAPFDPSAPATDLHARWLQLFCAGHISEGLEMLEDTCVLHDVDGRRVRGARSVVSKLGVLHRRKSFGKLAFEPAAAGSDVQFRPQAPPRLMRSGETRCIVEAVRRGKRLVVGERLLWQLGRVAEVRRVAAPGPDFFTDDTHEKSGAELEAERQRVLSERRAAQEQARAAEARAAEERAAAAAGARQRGASLREQRGSGRKKKTRAVFEEAQAMAPASSAAAGAAAAQAESAEGLLEALGAAPAPGPGPVPAAAAARLRPRGGERAAQEAARRAAAELAKPKPRPQPQAQVQRTRKYGTPRGPRTPQPDEGVPESKGDEDEFGEGETPGAQFPEGPEFDDEHDGPPISDDDAVAKHQAFFDAFNDNDPSLLMGLLTNDVEFCAAHGVRAFGKPDVLLKLVTVMSRAHGSLRVIDPVTAIAGGSGLGGPETRVTFLGKHGQLTISVGETLCWTAGGRIARIVRQKSPPEDFFELPAQGAAPATARSNLPQRVAGLTQRRDTAVEADAGARQKVVYDVEGRPTNAPPSRLTVMVQSAAKLDNGARTKCNAFVELRLGHRIPVKTATVKRADNPIWSSEHRFNDVELGGDVLQIAVWDDPRATAFQKKVGTQFNKHQGRDRLLFKVEVPLSSLEPYVHSEQAFSVALETVRGREATLNVSFLVEDMELTPDQEEQIEIDRWRDENEGGDFRCGKFYYAFMTPGCAIKTDQLLESCVVS